MVDAHCHVGLDAHGAVDDATSEQQALTDRDAGALLLRDAGSPADTRWVDDRDDLPVLVRAGRHIARPKRYIRDFADEVEPADLVETVRRQAARGDGWVKLVGDWIDRDTGDLEPCWPLEALRPAMAAAHEAGARVTAHCFSESSLADLVEAGIDCIEHATGLDETTLPLLAARGVAIVPTLINIETFPGIAASAEEKFPAYAAHMRALHARRYDTVARGPRGRHPRLRRHRRRRLARARPDRRRGAGPGARGTACDRGALGRDVGGARVARSRRPRRGRAGRPARARRRPARGPARAAGPARGRAARDGPRRLGGLRWS